MEENKKMGLIDKFINSIYNPKAYNEFLKQSTGKAILYIFLLSLILGIINSLFFILPMNSVISSVQEEIEDSIPYFELKDGHLNVEGDMPIEITDDEAIIYIDTENPIDPSIIDDYDIGYLITSDSIIVKSGNMTQSLSFNNLANEGTLTKDQLISLMPLVFKVITIMFIIVYPLGTFLGKLLTAVVLAIFGIIICKFLNKPLRYSECFKLSLYALTVPMLLNTLNYVFMFLSGIVIGGFTLIYYVTAVVYLFIGIKSLDESTIDSLEEMY